MIAEKIINHLNIVKTHLSDFEQIIITTLEDYEFDKDKIRDILKQIEKRENMISFYTGNNTIIPRALIEKEGVFEIFFIVTENTVNYNNHSIKIIILFIYSSEFYNLFIETLPFFIRLTNGRINIDSINVNNENELEDIVSKGLKSIEN